MKFFYFVFFFVLISLYHCEEENQLCDETCEKMTKLRNKNNQKFNETIKQTLKEMNLENAQKITVDQFKTVFMKLYELGKSETNYKVEDDEVYRNQLFKNLVPAGANGIEVDKIFECFEPIKILRSLKNIELYLGNFNKIDFLNDNLQQSLEEAEKEAKQKHEKSSDL